MAIKNGQSRETGNGTQDTGRRQHTKTADNLNGEQNGPHQKPG